MIRTFAQQLLSLGLSFALFVTSSPVDVAAQQPPAAAPGSDAAQPAPPPAPAPLSATDLQQLVAPIALYPDALIAQILGAATFPDQVADADAWLQQNKSLTGTPLMEAVDKQPWDPSVKALTQFASVLDNMTKNLSWTSSLGEAYHNQAVDVMTAVQVLRAKAKEAGNLKTTTQIKVVQESPQVIVIQPASPTVVYVPQYNPTVVYGAPVVTPGYSTAEVVATGMIMFGVGIAVGVAINNSCCGWGYSYWNCNWHGGTVVYHSNVYYGNAAWHGGVYGSSVTAYGPNGVARAGTAYNSSTGTYARGATVATPYGTRSAAQAYNPNTGTYARGVSGSGPNGAAAAGQAYNPKTGAYGATVQGANAYGSAGSSVVSKNGNTAYTQHQSTANGTTGSIQTSNGAKGGAAVGANGNAAAAGQTSNGDKYAAANGNVYKNTGSGWQQTQGTPHSSTTTKPNSTTSKPTSSYSGSPSASSAASKGYGQQKSGGSSAFSGGGGGGWQSRQASARGSASRGRR